jgi:hypothetical protein
VGRLGLGHVQRDASRGIVDQHHERRARASLFEPCVVAAVDLQHLAKPLAPLALLAMHSPGAARFEGIPRER